MASVSTLLFLSNAVLINMNKDRYGAATSRNEKVFVAQQIVVAVMQTGRFLKFDKASQVWREVSETTARQKVCQALQYRLRRPVAQQGSKTNEPTLQQQQQQLPIQPQLEQFTQQQSHGSQESQGLAIGYDHSVSQESPIPYPEIYGNALLEPDDSETTEENVALSGSSRSQSYQSSQQSR